MTFSRGQILLVNFPHSDLVTIKRRPVLVVQSDLVRNELPQLIAATITSNLSRAGRPGRVSIQLGSPAAIGTGLRADSVIALDHLATVREALVARPIGVLSDMSLVDAALRLTLSL